MADNKKIKSKTCITCNSSFTPVGEELCCKRCDPEAIALLDDSPKEETTVAVEAPKPPVVDKKVLVIDDEPAIVHLLKSRLESKRYHVITAGDGEEGLEAAKSEKPDLIILDVLMPKMTGYQLVERLRHEGDDVKDIPVIVMSAKHSMRDFFPAWAVLTFLSKPFRPQEMLEKVTDAIGSVEEAEEAAAAGMHSDKRVLVVAVEEYILGKVKSHLESCGYSVYNGVNEAGVLSKAKTWQPDIILGQFWEDPSIMDVTEIARKLKEIPATQSIPFLSFAAEHLGLEAVKSLGHAKVLTYHNSDTLVKELEEFLKKTV